MQLKRIRMVIEGELSELQRQTLLAYYIHKQTIPQIAAARGVHKSTVSRTLRRAEANLRKYLKY
jgi:RNA polymerase sigma factor (sigma-70 family)